jgi:hypothetical protein
MFEVPTVCHNVQSGKWIPAFRSSSLKMEATVSSESYVVDVLLLKTGTEHT